MKQKDKVKESYQPNQNFRINNRCTQKQKLRPLYDVLHLLEELGAVCATKPPLQHLLRA